jgi:hypothetical protein
MSIINTLSLKSNRQIKINFDGGDLSSDAGLLLIKEFVSKLGIDRLFSHLFKTNDSALFRYHTDKENLLQLIYMIIAGYFEDDASDELTNFNYEMELSIHVLVLLIFFNLKLLKIAAKVIHSARYITFKLCSSCPYKNEFYETLSNISRLDMYSWNSNN